MPIDFGAVRALLKDNKPLPHVFCSPEISASHRTTLAESRLSAQLQALYLCTSQTSAVDDSSTLHET